MKQSTPRGSPWRELVLYTEEYSTTDVTVKGDEVGLPEPRGACPANSNMVADATTKLSNPYLLTGLTKERHSELAQRAV
jgi:hypothetical protein